MSEMTDATQRFDDEERPVARVDASLEQLIPRYLERRRDDAEAIERALSAEDWTTVTTLGHSMKGSGGGYGFDAITEIGALIEKAGREHESEAALDQVARLRHYLEIVVVKFVEE